MRATRPHVGGHAAFETLDYATVEGDNVVTASPPFSGYLNSFGILDAAAGGILATATRIPVRCGPDAHTITIAGDAGSRQRTGEGRRAVGMPERPAEGTILALDNVPLDLPVAGAATRALAVFLDYLIVALLVVLFVFALIALAVVARPSGGWIVALVVIGLFVIDTGYFAGLELASGGRTFGKWALGLRVVMQHGGRPGALALLARNAVRSVDLVVGVPLMAADPLARRLGDRLAGTLVVHNEARAGDVVLARVPRGWGAREVALAEGFLRRADELEPARAEALARSLLASIERDDPELLAGLPPDEPLPTLRRALGKSAA